MQYKLKFLIEIKVAGGNYKLSTCWFRKYSNDGNPNIEVTDEGLAEASAKMSHRLNQHIVDTIGPYIDYWARPEKESVRCPNERVKLPIDSSYCKVKDLPCPLQGIVASDNTDSFHEKCFLDSEDRLKILKTLKDKIYQGHHHVPGAIPCHTCQDDKPEIHNSYHFKWLLTRVCDRIPNFPEDLDAENVMALMDKGFDLSWQSKVVCTNCFLTRFRPAKLFEEMKYIVITKVLKVDNKKNCYYLSDGDDLVLTVV